MARILWNAAVSGDFADALNWNPEVVPNTTVPDEGDASITVLGPKYTVTSSADETINSLYLLHTLDVAAGTFSITDATTNSLSDNAYFIMIEDGAALEIGGTFENTGTIQF